MESCSTRYHIVLGEYFKNQSLYLSQNLTNIRKVSELFWQLRKAHNWEELITQIKIYQLIVETWVFNPYDLQVTWTEIENTRPKSLLKAYDQVLNYPEFFMWMVGKNPGTSKLFTILAQLFFFKGYYNEAFKMADHIHKYFSKGKLSIIWEAVALQCQLFIVRGEEKDMQAAWNQISDFKLIVQAEGDPLILDAILSLQATILHYTNQIDESTKIINE